MYNILSSIIQENVHFLFCTEYLVNINWSSTENYECIFKFCTKITLKYLLYENNADFVYMINIYHFQRSYL